MSIKDELFPENSRNFPGLRWVNVSLRTLHLIGVAGIGGAFLYRVPFVEWVPYMWITILSGAVMLLLEIWCNGAFLIQLRGIAMLVKLLLLAGSLYLDRGMYVMILVIVISGIISHAPAKVRYFMLLKRFQASPGLIK